MHQQILLIDDSISVHPLVTSLLSGEPVTIHSTFDAKTGILMAASSRPDLILLDVEMPDLDGFEACRRLKTNPVTASIPIIFLTARAGTEELVHGLDVGANDYVTKPFKLPELVSRVRAALRTSHLIRLLEQKAMIDPLTGLGSRAMFDERFAAVESQGIGFGNPLSCIIVDVDHFKGINDKHGHPFGDYVLSKIGEALIDVCRDGDVACRLGGEEFVVLALRTSSDHAALLAERIRAAVAQIPFVRHGEPVSVTCSIGIAEAVGVCDRSLLERADQALYQSKKNGRNRVSVAPAISDSSAVAA